MDWIKAKQVHNLEKNKKSEFLFTKEESKAFALLF